MNVAVCSNRRFVAVKIHQCEIALLQLLVLVTDVQTDGIGQQTGAVLRGAQAQAHDNLVGIEVIDLGVAGRLER